MINNKNARIPCSTETRELIKAQKRGGQSYDELLRLMAKQYDPEEAVSEPFVDESRRKSRD